MFMKKIRLTEQDLTNIISRVIEEQGEERVITSYKTHDFGKWGFKIYNEKGLKPYYLDLKTEGEFKLIELTEPLGKKTKVTEIFLLKPDEVDKTIRVIEVINGLTKKYLEKIKLLKELIPSKIVHEIIG